MLSASRSVVRAPGEAAMTLTIPREVPPEGLLLLQTPCAGSPSLKAVTRLLVSSIYRGGVGIHQVQEHLLGEILCRHSICALIETFLLLKNGVCIIVCIYCNS